MAETGRLWTLYTDLKAGRISRRAFMRGATALGVAAPILQFILNAAPAGAAPAEARGGARVSAQQSATRPTAGMENRKRGEGGELKILLWQAPTVLNAHANNGTKDQLACSFVSEPLMNYAPDGALIANLIKDVPAKENGLLAQDLTSVTYNLLDGVTWSDGEPFSAKDVVFTWQWIMNTDNQSTDIEIYKPIKDVVAVSDSQVKITFSAPQLAWYLPFTGTSAGAVFPQHVLQAGGKSVNQAFAQKPIGTGPFVVDSFKPGDQVIYKANEKYREPNKPYFQTVNVKGGGDAASAARAVLETGDFDFAWNLQVEPAVLNQMEKSGGKGKLVAAPGNSVEAIRFNFSDPNKEVDGQRSYWKQPHPVLSDKAVRQALSLGCNRDLIAKQFYQGPPGEPATANILAGMGPLDSKNTSWEFNIEKGKQVLEAAGWKLNGDVREKNGVKIQLSYTTSINSVRQKTQAVVKQAWEELGAKVQLKQVDAGVFFDSAAGNDLTIAHLFVDLEMYTDNPTSPFPKNYMSTWYGGDGANIAQKENGWSKTDYQRYNNEEFNKLYESLDTLTDTEKAAEAFIRMNDIVIDDFAVVPLVQRAADKYAISNTLRDENVALGPFEGDFWNIANWNRTT